MQNSASSVLIQIHTILFEIKKISLQTKQIENLHNLSASRFGVRVCTKQYECAMNRLQLDR